METLSSLPTLVDYSRARARWSDPAHAAARRSVEERARAAIDLDLRPVAEAGGWGHAFFCPDHVEPLEFEPTRPAAHRCPVDGRLWEGEDFDGGWVCTLNGRIMAGLQAGSLLWRLDGDTRARDYVHQVVLRYAELYRELPPYGRWAGKGRITGQSLEEAVWALGIIDVIDRMGDAFDEDERATIRTGLLEPLAEHLLGQRLLRVHNIECWHLASLAALGAALDDDQLITAAVDGPTGLNAQFDEGILDDGWWVEGSPHYHFYMATAMLHAVRALRGRRPDFTGRADLREMLITPLSMVRDDLSLPAMNDGWHSIALPNGIAAYAGHYEIGHALWGDPRFAEVLAVIHDHGAPRASEAALLYGPDLPTGAGQVLWERRDLHPASGYAILRDDDPDGRWLLLKYGPHGGGHGHPDKLQLLWCARGVRLAPDAGSPAYTSPLQGPWFRQTLAHNCVVIDGQSQPPTTGHLITHRPPAAGSPIGVADAWVGWGVGEQPVWGGSWLAEPREPTVGPYGGVLLRRTVLWHPDYLIDIVRSRADGERDVELAFHHRGERVGGPELTPTVEERGGAYAYLSDVARLATKGRTWTGVWQVEGVTTRLWALDPDGGTVTVARTPTSPPAESRATTVRRGAGTDVAFVSVLEACPGTAGKVQDVAWSGELADGTLVISVRTSDGVDHWHVGTGNPDSDPDSDTDTDSDTEVRVDGHDHWVWLADLEAARLPPRSTSS